MQFAAYVDRLIDLMDPAANIVLNMTPAEASDLVAAGDPRRIDQIQGQFAFVRKSGNLVRMARTIGRPMRYFLAKQADGPCLIVAERIEELYRQLQQEGLADQFQPSYTRMAPAHHLVEIALVGCPDPSPRYQRFFAPQRNQLPTDLDEIGEAYVGALAEACRDWLDRVERDAPIGVLFSGGVDSGSVFLVLYDLLLRRGESPARLKAFTLSVAGGADVRQSREFVDALDLGMFLEVLETPPAAIDYRAAIRDIEDYQPLDVQAAAMGRALCQAIRQRYPDWRYLVDGDGGDENLKDYPIEENPELTIRSVLNNTMLYQEGWGVNALKHSLTYSGGQSRGHVRSYAPARRLGFTGFSPYALPQVIRVAEAIPFIELTGWDHQRLYALKGEIVRRGVERVTGLTMPVFGKRRFQHGAIDQQRFANIFPQHPLDYRRAFDQEIDKLIQCG